MTALAYGLLFVAACCGFAALRWLVQILRMEEPRDDES